ncbi:hypothetical protein HMPREF3223_00369 [Cutibacterium avidum]|nr:hypothetical protein HMPREF3223_00369 [Cutibacterium avidum]
MARPPRGFSTRRPDQMCHSFFGLLDNSAVLLAEALPRIFDTRQNRHTQHSRARHLTSNAPDR